MKLTALSQALAVLGFANAACAQSPHAVELERVEVTGSNLKRVNVEEAPIQVLTREEIERLGIASAEQLVAALSANGTGARPVKTLRRAPSGTRFCRCDLAPLSHASGERGRGRALRLQQQQQHRPLPCPSPQKHGRGDRSQLFSA